MMLNLFNSYVASLLNYSSEVRGFIKEENIERAHRKFMKRLSNVKIRHKLFLEEEYIINKPTYNIRHVNY
jgi:hypothetical protein